MEEEISSSDSTTNDDDADGNASEQDASQIPEDLEDVIPSNSFGVVGIGLGHNVSQSSIPETASNHDSTEEFFDTIDEPDNTNNSTNENQ